jgi:hypothetical protein
MGKKTSWPLVVLGIGAFVLVVGVGLVAVAGYVIYQQIAFQATPSNEVSAEKDFKQAVLKYEGQEPYLIIKDGEPVINHEAAPMAGKPIEAIRIMIWDPDKRKVVKLNMPFWLLRMSRGQPIKISSDDEPGSQSMHLRITVEDLEKRGPGPILDQKEATGQRVLVWAE